MSLLIINGNLKPKSTTGIMCDQLAEICSEAGTVDRLNAWEYPLPCCDAGASFGDEHIPLIKQKMNAADVILIGSPVYNYTLTSYVKTLIEHAGDAWSNKVVGFGINAGGASSYMAVFGTIQSLMLDFRCWVIPRYVYADSTAFSEGKIVNPDVYSRLRQLAHTAQHLAGQYSALFPVDS